MTRLTGYVCATLLAGMVVTMLLQVVFRYVLNASLSWSEELARLLFVWLTFVGFSLAAERGHLPAISIVTGLVRGRAAGALGLVRDAVGIGVALLAFAYGAQLTAEVAGVPTPALQISAGWFPAAVSAGGLLLAYQLLAKASAPLAALGLALVPAIGVPLLPHGFAPVGPLVLAAFVTVSATGVPIALALTATAFVALADAGTANLDAIVRQLQEGVNSFVLLAIPFFMLTGVVMSAGGLAERLVRFAQSLVGWMRGGLAQVDTLVSAIFADISGSAAGDAAAVGSVLIPQMVRQSYPPHFAAAVQAAGGTLGLLFPPATALIVYSSVTNVPISRLFAAAVVPGLVVTAAFMAVNVILARRLCLAPGEGFRLAAVPGAAGAAILPLFTIVIIIGGILGGVFTPTESGVIAIAYSLLVAFLAMRTLRLRALPELLVEASVNTARVTSIIAGATAIGWILALEGIPGAVSGALLGNVASPVGGILLINLIFLVVHLAMEAAPAILVVMPVLLPAIATLHIDPIQLGITIMINSGMGMILPPLGILTFLTASVAGVTPERVFRTVVPYALALLVVLLAVAFVPALSLR